MLYHGTNVVVGLFTNKSLTERDLESSSPLQDLKNYLPPVPDFVPIEKAREHIEKLLPDKLHPLNILGLK